MVSHGLHSYTAESTGNQWSVIKHYSLDDEWNWYGTTQAGFKLKHMSNQAIAASWYLMNLGVLRPTFY